MMRYVFILCVFALLKPVQVNGQLIYHVYQPTNNSCATALEFCQSFQYFFDYHDTTNFPCVFFRFDLTDTTYINIHADGSAFKLRISGPFPTDGSCPDSLCSETGSLFADITGTHPPGAYYIHGYFGGNPGGYALIHVIEGLHCGDSDPCTGCLPSFSPMPDKKYVISAWVKKEAAPLGTINYVGPQIKVEAPIGTVLGTYTPSVDRPVIDGWQLMENTFTMPSSPSTFKVSLNCTADSAFFDDVRIFPADGSMKCYVYDPVNLRFTAELDERHYATYYEYDNEGKLVRVKKETERGVMTIKESRNNSSHLQP